MRSAQDVDDIASEWLDRFGPIPDPAAALVQVAYLRAECVRVGVTNVTVTKNPALSGGGLVASISPITLAQSKQMRLERLFKGSTYRDADHELRLRVAGGPTVAQDIVAALRELVPEVVAAPA